MSLPRYFHLTLHYDANNMLTSSLEDYKVDLSNPLYVVSFVEYLPLVAVAVLCFPVLCPFVFNFRRLN